MPLIFIFRYGVPKCCFAYGTCPEQRPRCELLTSIVADEDEAERTISRRDDRAGKVKSFTSGLRSSFLRGWQQWMMYYSLTNDIDRGRWWQEEATRSLNISLLRYIICNIQPIRQWEFIWTGKFGWNATLTNQRLTLFWIFFDARTTWMCNFLVHPSNSIVTYSINLAST